MATPEPKAAARKALADYLRTQFAGSPLSTNYPGLVVNEKWPIAGQAFPALALTVVCPSTPVRLAQAHQPYIWSTTPLGGGTHQGTVVYSYGHLEIDVQLDAWTQYPAIRDKLANDLEAQLNRPAAATMAASTDEYARGIGLVLPVGDLYNAPADFRLAQAAGAPESSDVAQGATYRAMFTGTATVYAVDQQTFYLMEQIVLQLTQNNGSVDQRQFYP